jgi:GAF domain-containing protein
LHTAEIRYFTDADFNFAMAVAGQGGVAIQRAIDYNRIEKSE